MDEQTLEALKGSIAKWERNAVAESPFMYSVGGHDCPLCVLFNEPYDHPDPEDSEDEDIDPDNTPCTKCPVMQKTGRRYCVDTPYVDAHIARYAWRMYEHNKAKSAQHDEFEDHKKKAQECARNEVEFLKSLLPENQNV